MPKFGYKDVESTSIKRSLVQGVFSSVHSNYDLMNDVMSGGLHRLWKDHFVKTLAPQSDWVMLDVAGGTGDIAFRLAKSAQPQTPITVYDYNPDMLDTGKLNALNKGFTDLDFNWVVGDAAALPFNDNQFDLYTISFGLRNVSEIDKALSEAFRCLKAGGKLAILEFCPMDVPVLDKAYKFYTHTILPNIGKKLADDYDSYKYLAESIDGFDRPDQLELRALKAGFKTIQAKKLPGSIVQFHIYEKLLA